MIYSVGLVDLNATGPGIINSGSNSVIALFCFFSVLLMLATVFGNTLGILYD